MLRRVYRHAPVDVQIGGSGALAPGARSRSVTKLAVSGQLLMTASGQMSRLIGGGAVSSKPPYPPRRLTERGALAFRDRVGPARRALITTFVIMPEPAVAFGPGVPPLPTSPKRCRCSS